jgi:hypothetical protein
MRSIVSMLACLFALAAQAQTQFVDPDTAAWSPAERALLDLEKTRSAAIARHDLDALRRMYADEFRGVTATGYPVDRERLMEVFKRDDPSNVFTIDEIAVRVLGQARDTAVFSGRLTTKKRDGGEVLGQSRFIHVYVLRDGRWQILYGQGTRLS